MGFPDRSSHRTVIAEQFVWFVVSASKADPESLDLAEPALALGLGDAGMQVVADLHQTVALVGVGPKHRAADAGVFVTTGGTERTPAGADGDLAPLEVAQEFGPLLVGWDAVFIGWPHGSSTGQEGQMGLDGLVGIDRLVAESDVDVLVRR